MKKSLAALCLCLSVPAFAATFSWDAVPGAAGYRAYCGSATGVYATAPLFDLTAAPVMTSKAIALDPGTYFCVMRAYASATQPESANSNEATVTIPALSAPANFKLIARFTLNPATGKYDMNLAYEDANGVVIPIVVPALIAAALVGMGR